jgi:hypothetical protein
MRVMWERLVAHISVVKEGFALDIANTFVGVLLWDLRAEG